jgi:hypothetical protein
MRQTRGCAVAAAACPGCAPETRGRQCRGRQGRLARALRPQPDGGGAGPRPGRADGATGARAYVGDGTGNRRSIRPAHRGRAVRGHLPAPCDADLSLGGLPDQCDFGAPAPELVQAIVTGVGPSLRALDLQTAT